jgi:hypothetical protein
MGYACPVCGDPQQDERHLANHLAFTALLGREDHEAWLEEHAPGWADDGERELADRVAEHATETEFPQVFEDTTGGESEHDDPETERSGALFDGEDDHVHGREPGQSHDHGGGHARSQGRGDPDRPHDTPPGVDAATYEPVDPDDPATQEILEEARELTREMRGAGEVEADEDAGDGQGEEKRKGDADDETD